MLSAIKNSINRKLKRWRRRRGLEGRVARLEADVQSLRRSLEVTSAFYERRLDAAIRALIERSSTEGSGLKANASASLSSCAPRQ